MAEGEQDSGNGFPAGFQLFTLEGDEEGGGIGLNTKARRSAIGEQQAAWIENYMPIGPANTRALWGVRPAIYNTATVINICFYNIGSTAYAIVFKLDGSAIQVRISDGATTTVGAAGTFYGAGDICTPTIVQFSNAGILIVSKHAANAYWAWDGTLWPPGNPTSPAWLNGGTATAMPTGISGTDIEVYLSRIWIIDGTNILTSAASNGANFTIGPGAIKPNQDSTLRRAYTALMQSNGYLYVLGDSQCAYITNVQTSTVPITTYQYTVIDPQIGTPWRDSLIPFGRSLLFANTNGIYALYGSSANKISDPLDGIWNDTQADFTSVLPSSGVSTIFGIKTFCISLRTIPPGETTARNIVCMFDGKKWFIGSQNPTPLILAPQEMDSHLACFGTDGAKVYEVFAVADATLTKKLVTKLWGGRFGFVMQKQILRYYLQAEVVNNQTAIAFDVTLDNENGSQPGVVNLGAALTFINNAGGILQFQNNSHGNLFFQSNAPISKNDANGSGLLLGFTLTSTSPDYVYERGAIGYKELTAFY